MLAILVVALVSVVPALLAEIDPALAQEEEETAEERRERLAREAAYRRAQEQRATQIAHARRERLAPDGTLTSIEYHFDLARRLMKRAPARAPFYRRRANRWLQAVMEGRDPIPEVRGKIVTRAYRSPISTRLQPYSIYLPPDYDPERAYPLYIALHGGSSNANLFMGVFLGNNLNWREYHQHLYDEFTPQWNPDWIIVAPNGFGQIIWRWMGERDVFDVLADVKRHHKVDEDRIVLGGVSNGGMGAHAIGARHASKFSLVQAMAGAPSWIQYVGNPVRPEERRELLRYSAMHLIENTFGTEYRFYHGRRDTGPMRPRYIEALIRRMRRIDNLPVNIQWFDAGHDILYPSIRLGRAFEWLDDRTRQREPREVFVVTGDYRAARQHWIEVTRLSTYPDLARIHGTCSADEITLEASGARAIALHLREAPLEAERVSIRVNNQQVHIGPRAALGDTLHLVRRDENWELGFPGDDGERVKRPGMSGPIQDAYYDRMVHVYGTQVPEARGPLRRAAEEGANGWPLWIWDVRQEVVADTEVTDEMIANAHLVLYSTHGANAVLERIKSELPIQIEEDAVVVGDERFENAGTRFIYPNPENPERYVIVQGATSPRLAMRGNELPEFLPDWIVYARSTLRGNKTRILQDNHAHAMGWFDDDWRLAGEHAPEVPPAAPAPAPTVVPAAQPHEPTEGAGDEQETNEETNEGTNEGTNEETEAEAEPALPVPRAPRVPPRATAFLAGDADPAGIVARRIAKNVPTFHNFRAEIPGANWRTRDEYIWKIRPQQECYEALRQAGIPARPTTPPMTPVPSPVEILGPIDDVWLRSVHEDRPITISCELATRLPEIIAVFKRHGVLGLDVLSAYRTHPRPSFHTMGLALDVSRVYTADGWLSVASHYHATPMAQTCSRAARPRGRRARLLHDLACDLYESDLFTSVLTPNYNEGHRDHFHFDIRPQDPRHFLR